MFAAGTSDIFKFIICLNGIEFVIDLSAFVNNFVIA